MVDCVPVALNQIEKHHKIAFCYVISRLTQKFDKIKLLELLNKLDSFNKQGLNNDFQVSVFWKVSLQLIYLPKKITYICALS